MADDTPAIPAIEARGLRFPGAEAALTAAELAELRDGGLKDTLAKIALSVARPADRILVCGGGSGLIPALLAGRLGVRHLTILEPDPGRHRYIAGVLAENRLVRAALCDSLPPDLPVTLVVCDLSPPVSQLLPPPDGDGGLRGVVVRVPDSRDEVARVFERMASGGLTYFPRQSCGNVITFLSRWH